jgi:hypothetical protein
MSAGEAAQQNMHRTAEQVRHGVDCRCVQCQADKVVERATRRR